MFKGIDFYSDTITRPTAAMKRAMIEAELGDEQKGEDPTTRKLEERTAQLLGHTSAMFFPSATMANEVAIRLHCEPGDELIAAANCHLFFAEAGGPAIHSQVMSKPVDTTDGIFSGEDVRRLYRWAKGSHYPVTKLVSVENTTNMGGGVPWTRAQLQSVHSACNELGLKAHLDGSRLFNASVASGLSPKDIASDFDSATICLSKGLGCAAGAVLVFDQAHWTRVRRLKQLMGGALRQSGILAAAGLYALENNVQRLAEDHANAQHLAARLSDNIPHVIVERQPPSNMVFFRWSSSTVPTEKFLEDCQARGVRFSQVDRDRVRAVTHLDVSQQDMDKAAAIVREVAQSY